MKRRGSATEEQRHAALTELLARPDAGWAAVMTLLASWPAGQEPGRAIEAVEAVAERWPPHARGLSRLAVQQLLAGEVRPYLRLVRALDLRPLWSLRDRAGLLAQMIREAGVRELAVFVIRYDEGDAIIRLITRHIVGLRALTIGGSGVSPAGARVLAEASALAGLRLLALHNNRIDDAGAGALVDSPHLGELRSLNLYGNRLTALGARRVSSAPRWLQAGIVVHGQRPGELLACHDEHA